MANRQADDLAIVRQIQGGDKAGFNLLARKYQHKVSNLIARYVVATALLFSPIFFANLIYSTIFRDTEQANVAYGSNLLGTMVGGATEYLALYFGYQQLAIFAGLFYFVAFYMLYRRQQKLVAAVVD